MQTTASINFDNKKSFTRLRKHLEHDPNVKHSNDYLNSVESKKLRHLNRHVVNEDFNKLIEDNYKDYIDKHNQSAVKHGNYVWTSTDDFILHNAHGERRTSSIGSLMVAKFSDFKDFNDMLENFYGAVKKKNPDADKQKCKEDFLEACGYGLEDYANDFNRRNPNLHLTEYYIHLDEEGAPHLHARILPLTKSKSRGKSMSWGLNRALKEEFGDNDTRKNLSMFRTKEDKFLISCVNETIKNLTDSYGIDFDVSLLRKKPALTGLDHDEFVAEQKRQRMQTQQAKLAVSSQRLIDKSAEIDAKNDLLDERESDISAREQDVSQRESAVKARESSVAKRETDVKKRENETKKREEETKKQLERAIQLQKQSAEQLSVIQKIRTEYQKIYTDLHEKWKRFTNWLALKKENYPKEPDFSTLVDIQKKRKKTVEKINHDIDNDGIDDRFELPKIPDSYDLQLTENNKEEEQNQYNDSKNY